MTTLLDFIRRKALIMWLVAFALSVGPASPVQAWESRPQLPDTVAGVTIPKNQLALAAAAYVRSAEPPFLFNHSVRTYVFGAIRIEERRIPYDMDLAFVAALFHDVGLVASNSSETASFEVDSANAAEAFVRAHGGSETQGRIVWNAIVMHDVGRLYQAHQGGEAMLLGVGASTDVDGPPPGSIDEERIAQVVGAVPRLDFKRQFTALAIDHCRRKPTSQIGWLDGLCRKIEPNADRGSVEQEIAAAPFAE